jgi:hypothetical protein
MWGLSKLYELLNRKYSKFVQLKGDEHERREDSVARFFI